MRLSVTLIPALLVVGLSATTAFANPTPAPNDGAAPMASHAWPNAGQPMGAPVGGEERWGSGQEWQRHERDGYHHHHGHWHHRGHGGAQWHPLMMGGVLGVVHELGLTSEQHVKLKALHAETMTGMRALMTSDREIYRALATTAPGDAAYAGLVAKMKTNAATRVQMHADLNAKVYQTVLTEEQRKKAAALMAERVKRMGDRKGWTEHADRHEEHVKS